MISQRMYELGSKKSTIRELFEYGKVRAAEVGSENIYDFSIGNPSVPAPDCVREALVDILNSDAANIHGYTSAQGDIETRKAIADDLNARFNTHYSADNLFMTCGAAASLTITFNALCESETDEFIAIAPYFPEYKVFVEGSGAVFKSVPAQKGSFQIDIDALSQAIGENTKGVIINSPNNPTGAVYTEDNIAALAQLLREKSAELGKHIFLICDEPYREIVYGGAKAVNAATMYPDTIICYSYSKSLSLPGERIGYVLIPDEVCDSKRVYAAVAGAARSLGFVCAPSLLQKMLVRCAGATSDIEEYRKNRDLLYSELTDAGYECVPPDGAFYLFVKAPDGDDRMFSEIAKKYDILIVPGSDFGGAGYVRISYCVDNDMIRRSLPVFKKMMDEQYRAK